MRNTDCCANRRLYSVMTACTRRSTSGVTRCSSSTTKLRSRTRVPSGAPLAGRVPHRGALGEVGRDHLANEHGPGGVAHDGRVADVPAEVEALQVRILEPVASREAGARGERDAGENEDTGSRGAHGAPRWNVPSEQPRWAAALDGVRWLVGMPTGRSPRRRRVPTFRLPQSRSGLG